MLTGASPILVSADVTATVRFYTEVLGFPSSWMWGDPPAVGGASWGKVSLMFSKRPEFVGRVEGLEVWISTEDVDALYAMHLERGVMIVSPLEDKPWDRREYTVRDPDGYHLRFGGHPDHASKGVAVLPPGIGIVRRIPTALEYEQVVGSGFYRPEVAGPIFESAWAGVVALGPAGQLIGTTRIMLDAPGWFSIWDVAVLPEWQGRRIGSAMMNEALAIVREASPGARVYLFTHKHEFYERIGFEKGTVQTVSV